MIYQASSVRMPELENESVHAIITSPPYPMIEKWDECFARQKANTWPDQIGMILATLKEGIRVLIPGGIICLNIGDATRTINGNFQCYPNYAALTFLLLDMNVIAMTFKTEMVALIPIFWKKISNRPNAFLGSGFLPVNAYISQDHEYIGIFRKGELRKFNQDERKRRQQSKFTKFERDLWFQQVWNIQGKKGAKKDSGWPQEIPYRLMRMFTIEGDTILDPFCGPGEEELYNKYGRNFVGYEIGE